MSGSASAPSVSCAVRVFYEDTDAGGIVYYANYLRYFERARSELVRALGFHQRSLLAEGVGFAVRSAQIEYLKPARLDDLLLVETRVDALKRAQICFSQCISRDGERLVDATMRVACIDPRTGRPVALPREMHERFASLLAPAP